MASLRLLIIQLKRAGDVLVTTPILPAIKKSLPECTLHFLVDKPFAPLLENNPYVDAIHIYDRRAPWKTWRQLRKAGYDRIIDFQSSPRSVLAGIASGAPVRAGFSVPFWGRFLHKRVARPSGLTPIVEGKMTLVRSVIERPGVPEERRMYLTPEEKRWAEDVVSKSAPLRIGLIATHRRASRRWCGEHFVALAKQFTTRGYRVLWFWGPGERPYVESLQTQVPDSWLIPPTTLRQMAALLGQCRLVVTNDNGPMHLAVACGVPTVTLYGPTEPASWNPGGALHRALRADHVPCLGCNLNVCPFGHECMKELAPDQVLRSCEGLLS